MREFDIVIADSAAGRTVCAVKIIGLKLQRSAEFLDHIRIGTAQSFFPVADRCVGHTQLLGQLSLGQTKGLSCIADRFTKENGHNMHLHRFLYNITEN